MPALLVLLGILGSAFFVFLGPVMITRMNNRHALMVKKEDWRRQDEVAAAAKAASDAAAQSQAAIISVGALTVAKLTEVQEQVSIVHGMVNSAYTAALEATRVALVGQRDALVRGSGANPSQRDTDAVAAIDAQIKALEATIADRLAAQRLAEAQAQVTPPPEVPTFTVPVATEVAVFPPPGDQSATP